MSTITMPAKGEFVIGIDDTTTYGPVKAVSTRLSRVGIDVPGYKKLVWVDADKVRVVPEDERSLECFKCMGSGLFYSGGAVVNGVYTGQTGKCYACEGHGKQTPRDFHRNRTYWNKYARIYA